MSAQHTPTQLRITAVHRLYPYPSYIGSNDDDNENLGVFISMSFVSSNVPDSEKENFLERIVIAVNSHEALLEALKLAEDTLERVSPSREFDSIWGTKEIIKKAIAQAEVR